MGWSGRGKNSMEMCRTWDDNCKDGKTISNYGDSGWQEAKGRINVTGIRELAEGVSKIKGFRLGNSRVGQGKPA